jgi:hypothetical protein
MGRITSNQATVNSALSILTTGLTSAANIVTGQQAADILTGGANFATGSQAAINAHVYRNTFAFAISQAITSERGTILTALRGRYLEPITTFTVDDAIREANRYHGTCSFYKGLELILAAVRDREALTRFMANQGREARMAEIRARISVVQAALRGRPDSDPSENAVDLRKQLRELQAALTQIVLAPNPEPQQSVSEQPVTTNQTEGGGGR